jgi:hypothetical protein
MSKSAKPKDGDKVKTTHETRFLKCELTQEELLAAGTALARAIGDKQRLESESESIKRQLKAREAAIDSVVMVEQSKVRDKFEMRKVSCDLVLNYTKQEVYVVRKDTAEEIERREMSDDEKQMDMGFDASPVEAGAQT